MIRTLGFPLLFAAMFSIAGGHWAVLQSVAWTGMVIEYSKDSPLAEVLAKTFGGQAPCKICTAIEAGKEKESRLPATVKTDKKIDKFFSLAVQSAPLPAEEMFSYSAVSDEASSARPASPPTPVPIAA